VSLFPDELQGLQVAAAFLLRQVRYLDAVAGHRNQEGIGEVEVDVRDELVAVGIVVLHAKGQREAVEALRCEQCQVVPPAVAVVEPGKIFHVALKAAGYAAHRHRRLLYDRNWELQRARQALRTGCAVREFHDRIDQTPDVAAVDIESRRRFGAAGKQSEGFRRIREGDCAAPADPVDCLAGAQGKADGRLMVGRRKCFACRQEPHPELVQLGGQFLQRPGNLRQVEGPMVADEAEAQRCCDLGGVFVGRFIAARHTSRLCSVAVQDLQ